MWRPNATTASKLILLLFFLQSILPIFPITQGSEEHTHEIHCSRDRSRTAYKIIEEYLIPFVEQENYQMSQKCKLHPGNDMFRDQEEHKIHVDVNEWRCGYCKKSFRAEKFLDQHFDNRHYNLLNVSHNCLADLCGALHCDHAANSIVPKTKCNPAAAARNRHLCESLADSCFPVHQGPSASRLHEAYQHFLLGYININSVAASRLLCHSVSYPKRNEKGHTGIKAHLKTEPKEKAILVGQAHVLYDTIQDLEHSDTFISLTTSQVLMDGLYQTPN
ncbi:hypothetical protein M8C21_010061 [Ambrosia artemisiifolia]|uniref:C2H2-type domain-containing protein n=1 Tax=Ambrosia artemisiifolia TaxID=4212 RepID=A0AAD5BZF6_AMBAR|nr:hypothetical protein M8C21_010061 [Ambrosia artemisiifolia]